MNPRTTLPISEEALQDAIIERAQYLGWKVAHFRPAKTEKGWRTPVQADGKGWPDLVLVRGRIIFAELKSAKGPLSIEQRLWRDWLLAAGGEWYEWRPPDWMGGAIDAILGAKIPAVGEAVNAARMTRILAACDGDVGQARRIVNALDRRYARDASS